MQYKIAIIGGGSLGFSLAKGLIKSKQFAVEDIMVTDKRESRLQYLRESGFHVTDDNKKAVASASVVVFSVKPQQFVDVCNDIKDSIKGDKMFISTVTGVTLEEIENHVGKYPIARIVPNTALEILESMTCISMRNAGEAEKKTFIDMFDRMGKTLVISEDLMESATVTGACGTAFALRFIRAMSQGGIEIGFNSETSHFITAQTVKGAAQLLLETHNHPEYEIDKVTTPQGITISGLNEMEHQGLSSAVIKGLLASFRKLEKE